MSEKLIIASILATLFGGSCFAFGTANHLAKSVSLMQLIVNPEKYHGKLVSVIGVSNVGIEKNSICFSKEHSQYIGEECFWIVPDYEALKTTPEELAKFNGKYVLMEGVFNKDNHGHMGMLAGALENITRFELMEGIDERIKIK